ncbi:MAG: GreA/GreB family elongation factor [Gammaproteobacteria bacterium]|nr:GreA/GreB family elongation factor [Gammaproteobacteria bacterium]
MLNEIRQKLEDEIETLSRELAFELPERIRKAVELGDLRENSEYKSALERQQFVNARIGHLRQRVSALSQIDVEGMPPDRVGFGSRVTVHDRVRGMQVTYTIAAGDYIDIEAGHVSMASAIGRGLMGARQGEEVEVRLPSGIRRYEIVELETLPQRMGMS